jgi:hypothetical protein
MALMLTEPLLDPDETIANVAPAIIPSQEVVVVEAHETAEGTSL